MKISIVFVILCSLVWFGCSEKETTTNSNTSDRMNNLTSGEWVRVKHELNGKDVFPIFPECSKDDLLGYLSNGDAYVDQGKDVCDPASPQRTSWKWAFIENETKIEETIGDSTVYVRIIRVLTNSQFSFVSYNNQDSLVSSFEKL